MTGRVVRSIKNYAKGFSEVQIKVRKATSNDSTGPSGTLMNEIAQLTFNPQDFIEIMDMIDKRLNDKGKNWRHVFKALLLLDYCLLVGSDSVVSYAKENIYVVKTLKEFQHIDDVGTDVGANVRQKAKNVVNLLQDNKRLKNERKKRKEMREKMGKVGDYINEVIPSNNSNIDNDDDGNNNGDGGNGYYDELKFALKESKRIAIEEEKKRKQGEDDDLAIAIKLSEQEAIKKEKESQSQQIDNDDNRNTPQFNALFNPYSKLPQQSQSQPHLIWNQDSNLQFENNNNSSDIFQTTNNPYLHQQQQPQIIGNQINLFNNNNNNNLQQQQSSSFNLINQQNPFLSSNIIPSNQQMPSLPFQTPQSTGSSRNPFTQQINHPSTTSLFDNNSFTFNNNNNNNNNNSNNNGNMNSNSHISVFDPISNNNNHLNSMVSSSPFTMAK